MENILINFLLTNCKTLAKEFFSSEAAATEEGNGGLNFSNLLEAKMGNGIVTLNAGITRSNTGITTSNAGIVDGAASKEKENETFEESNVEEDDLKDLSLNFSDTQSILTLLQTYLQTQNIRDNTLGAFQSGTMKGIADETIKGFENNTKSISIEKFLQNVFSLLREGESVQFSREKLTSSFSLANMSKNEETAAEPDQHPVVESGKAMENNALISYLTSILQKFDVSEKTVKKAKNAETDNGDTSVNEYGQPHQNTEVLKMSGTIVTSKQSVKATDEMVKLLQNKTETPINLESENKENREILDRAETTVKSLPGIEVKKLNDKENIIQISSNGSSSREGEEVNKNISVLTMKTQKPSFSRDNNLQEYISNQSLSGQGEETNKSISVLAARTEKATPSRDDEVIGIISRLSNKTANEHAGLDERQLLSQNNYTRTSMPHEKETGKILEKTPFASIVADRIEKLVEQYANKSSSMDMVVRLKIDEKETLLVSLKEQGQRVNVEVKTTNEGVGNFLHSQKDEITRQLEGKHVYASICIDLQNENREKKEQKDNRQKKRSDDQEKRDFVGFLEAMA
jgi:hypothetical protein